MGKGGDTTLPRWKVTDEYDLFQTWDWRGNGVNS